MFYWQKLMRFMIFIPGKVDVDLTTLGVLSTVLRETGKEHSRPPAGWACSFECEHTVGGGAGQAPGAFSGPILSFLSLWLMREEELEAFRMGLGVCVTFCGVTSLKDILWLQKKRQRSCSSGLCFRDQGLLSRQGQAHPHLF